MTGRRRVSGFRPVAVLGKCRYYGGMLGLVRPHGGKELTGREMRRLASVYWQDLPPKIRKMKPWEFYETVKKIPYSPDDDLLNRVDREILARPRYLLDRRVFPALDCKKKSILIGAHAQSWGIPWRLIAVAENGLKYHHVFPQLRLSGQWLNADATLPHYQFAEPKTVNRWTEI